MQKETLGHNKLLDMSLGCLIFDSNTSYIEMDPTDFGSTLGEETGDWSVYKIYSICNLEVTYCWNILRETWMCVKLFLFKIARCFKAFQE